MDRPAWWDTYKRYKSPALEFNGVMEAMHGLYGRSMTDSDFNAVKFWDLMEKVRMQGFREAIECLEEMDRADNIVVNQIRVLKQLYDAHAIASDPGGLVRRG